LENINYLSALRLWLAACASWPTIRACVSGLHVHPWSLARARLGASLGAWLAASLWQCKRKPRSCRETHHWDHWVLRLKTMGIMSTVITVT